MAVILNLSEIIPSEWREWLPYLITAVVFFVTTYLIGLAMFHMTKLVLPKVAVEYIGDFLKTMLICAYPFGHGIIRRHVGEIGFLFFLILIMIPTIFTIEGEGNTVSVWIKFLRKKVSVTKMILKTVIMMTSGLAGYWLGRYVLELQVQTILFGLPNSHPPSGICRSFLNVPILQGFLLELIAVMYDSWFGSQKLSPNCYLDVAIKVLNTGSLVVAGRSRLCVCQVYLPLSLNCIQFVFHVEYFEPLCCMKFV